MRGWFEKLTRRLLRRLGVDIHRYPANDGLGRILELLGPHSDTVFLDVGASVGQFGSELRARGFDGQIASIEPVGSSFRRLARLSMRDTKWSAHHCAVSDVSGESRIHVSSNNAESSSLLAIGERHVSAYAASKTVGVETVIVRTLDEMFSRSFGSAKFALKLDVQGLEFQVLKGAVELFDSGRVIAAQIEASLVDLYENGSKFLDIHRFMIDKGFEIVFVRPGFSDSSWRLLQVDLFYFKYE